MVTNVLNLILNAEGEYLQTIKNAVTEAEAYVDQRKRLQANAYEQAQYELYKFETAENEKFTAAIIENERALERAAEIKKAELKARQAEKQEPIGERIKDEVLNFIWR